MRQPARTPRRRRKTMFSRRAFEGLPDFLFVSSHRRLYTRYLQPDFRTTPVPRHCEEQSGRSNPVLVKKLRDCFVWLAMTAQTRCLSPLLPGEYRLFQFGDAGVAPG